MGQELQGSPQSGENYSFFWTVAAAAHDATFDTVQAAEPSPTIPLSHRALAVHKKTKKKNKTQQSSVSQQEQCCSDALLIGPLARDA